MKRIACLLILCLAVFSAQASFADVATFDDLALASESYWNGSDESGMFISGDSVFMNGYNSSWGSWDGFAYSNTTDTTTAGYTNQFSAYTGGGVSGSANYAVAYDGGDYGSASPPNLSFGAVTGNDYDSIISGAYITNTTYAALSMINGDGFAKKFGGTTGNDADWFKLSITGINASGGYTSNSVDFYLADYRFDDNSFDYVLDEWTWVDLSGLGDIVGLEFGLSSSDTGTYGMNTPAYFAMDNLNAVPVPAAVWLLGSGIMAIAGIRRKISTT